MSNVSLLHEAPLEVLREAPHAVLDLLRVVGHAVGEHQPLEVAVIDSELTEAVPSARRADLVVQLRTSGGQVVGMVIVEVQRERDEEKPRAWPLYISHLHARHAVPVSLLVVTLDDGVARWARAPRRIGENLVLAPFAIGPADLPPIRSIENIRAHPELSMLIALARLGSDASAERHGEEVVRVFQAMLDLADARARDLYLPLLRSLARGALRDRLRKLLEEHDMGRVVEMIKEMERAEARAEGKAEGKAEGEAEAILRVLGRRGLHVDADTEQRIRDTRDLGILGRWLDRAVDARSVDEVLEG